MKTCDLNFTEFNCTDIPVFVLIAANANQIWANDRLPTIRKPLILTLSHLREWDKASMDIACFGHGYKLVLTIMAEQK